MKGGNKLMAKSKYFYSEAEQKRMNKLICQRIRDNIPIQDYAASRGFQLERKGKYYQIIGEKNHSDFSSVMINSETNRYKHYSVDNKPRSVIDFVMEVDGCDQATAINTLKPLIDTYDLEAAMTKEKKHVHKAEKQTSELTLPERADTSRNVYAYLTKTRQINKDIVDHFIYNGNLYQDNHNNCVFVRYDRQGNPTFCSKRGTNTYKRFMWEHPANDYNHCFFIDNGADTLIVNEAIIDTMSVMSIMQDCGRQINDYSYLNLSGTPKWEATVNILRENPLIKNVILACDNDDAGFTAMNNIKESIKKEFPDVKTTDFLPKTENDWNAQLQFNREHSISTSVYLKSSPKQLLSLGQGKNQSRHILEHSNILEFEKAGGGF